MIGAVARVGDVLGGWVLERELGRGGLATVFCGRRADGTRAAVKVLHSDFQSEPQAVERFLREAYLASRMSHPGVVRVLDASGRDEAFLVLELLEGEPLDRVVAGGGVTLPELLDYTDQILDVLAVMHEQGLIHRDIKPSNLFVSNGKIKLLDFGMARLRDDVSPRLRTRTGVALGTLAYMAPEQATGRHREVDGRTDLYGLGASLFRILSGRYVHTAPSEAELLVRVATEPAPKLASVAPNVPAEVSAIVDRALAFFQRDRYADARAMREDVAAVRAGRPLVHARPAAAVEVAARTVEVQPTLTDSPGQTLVDDSDATGKESAETPPPSMLRRTLTAALFGGSAFLFVGSIALLALVALLFFFWAGAYRPLGDQPPRQVLLEDLLGRERARHEGFWVGTSGVVVGVDGPKRVNLAKTAASAAPLLECEAETPAAFERVKLGDTLRVRGRFMGDITDNGNVMIKPCELDTNPP